MKKKWLFLVTLGLALALVVPVLSGCSSPAAAQSTPSQVQISQQPQGIWVSGTGEVSVTPDIAILQLGIVDQETTVAVAQTKASDAMNQVMKALTSAGVAAKDIQTGYFSISQRTRWDDQKQTDVVTGYQVSNMVTAKIRSLPQESYPLESKVGRVINAVAQAGGDLTRINGINFSVEDPTNYYQQAREKAMADAKKKADQLATLAKVTLGKPTYIADSSQVSPVYSGRDISMPVPAPTMSIEPPISTGELKITLNIQVAYSTN
jgi:uncharacterized protein YggE